MRFESHRAIRATKVERKMPEAQKYERISKRLWNPLRWLGHEIRKNNTRESAGEPCELCEGMPLKPYHFSCSWGVQEACSKYYRVRKISPKFSCIKFFQIWDVPTQIPGHPGHSLSKTTEKSHLHKVFVRDIPTSGS